MTGNADSSLILTRAQERAVLAALTAPDTVTGLDLEILGGLAEKLAARRIERQRLLACGTLASG